MWYTDSNKDRSDSMIIHGNSDRKPNIPGTFSSPFEYLQNQKNAKNLHDIDIQKQKKELASKHSQDISTSNLQQFDAQNRMQNMNNFFKQNK